MNAKDPRVKEKLQINWLISNISHLIENFKDVYGEGIVTQDYPVGFDLRIGELQAIQELIEDIFQRFEKYIGEG